MNLPKFTTPELVGIPIKQVSTFYSVAAQYNGRKLLCHVVNGHPATLCVIDLETNEIIFQTSLIGAESAWRLILHQDKVFIAGTGDSGQPGHLFAYSLADGKFEEFGPVCSGEKFLWSMATDGDRYIYIGTWPNGKIVQFDTATGIFTDFGTIVPGQNYLRSLTYLNGYLYAGVGPVGSLVRINPETFRTEGRLEAEHLEEPVKEILATDSLPFCYELGASHPYVLAYFDSPNKDLLAFNTETGSWEHLGSGYRGNMIQSDSGDLFYTTKNGLFRFNSSEGKPVSITPKIASTLRGGGVIGGVLHSVFMNGSLFRLDLEDLSSEITKSSAEGASTQVQTIFRGPDDKLYFSAYPGGTGAVYDPETGSLTRFPLEQAEGMGSLGADIYLGIYPHARLFKIDTTRPIDTERHPKLIWQINSKQDRPFVLTSGDGLLFVGTIPDYGVLGGGICVYDPKTESGQTYAPIIPNHSITSLLYKDGYLYGGTSIYGGLGIEPEAEHAVMFKWNVKTRELEEVFLPLKQAEKAPMISGLCEVNGLIYGNFNGYIFAYDPVSRRTIKYRNLYPEVNSFGRWRPSFNFLGNDGLIYSSVGAKVTAIDPETLNYKFIAGSDLFALGKNNEIYYVRGWQLLKTMPIYEDSPEVQVEG
ncbi:MAG TPA: hypothetical protein PLN81_08685 [Bacillota bacterium]|nr:hypothetical protein [Bacillota bacterium]